MTMSEASREQDEHHEEQGLFAHGFICETFFVRLILNWELTLWRTSMMRYASKRRDQDPCLADTNAKQTFVTERTNPPPPPPPDTHPPTPASNPQQQLTPPTPPQLDSCFPDV